MFLDLWFCILYNIFQRNWLLATADLNKDSLPAEENVPLQSKAEGNDGVDDGNAVFDEFGGGEYQETPGGSQRE